MPQDNKKELMLEERKVKALEKIANVLDAENAKSIKSSLRNIDRFTSILSKQSKQMSSIIEHVDELVKNTASASKALPNLMTTVSGTGKAMSRMSNSVTDTMKGSQKAINQISEQTLPKFNALMSELEEVTQTFGMVAKDIKKNPSMLLRGKTPRALGPGE